MATAAIIDSPTGIVVSLTDIAGDINAFQSVPGTYVVAAGPTVAVGDQYNSPSDGAFLPAAQVPSHLKNSLQVRQNAAAAFVRLREIRDAPPVATANLASVRALQVAVQDEATVLLALGRLMVGQLDGTT